MAAALLGTKAFNPSSDRTALELGDKAGVGVSQAEMLGVIHKTILTLTNLSITMTDAGAAGSHGSQKIYDFPAGAIQIHSAIYNLTTLAGSGGIVDGAALVGSLGSVAVATDNATLTSTEADVIASTAGTLTSGAGVLKKFSGAPAAPFDGTTTPVDLFLNLAVPNADSSANDVVLVSGTIVIQWLQVGDY